MVNYCCLSFGFCTYLCELFSPLWWSHSAQLWKSSAPGVVSRAVIIKMVYLLGTLFSSPIICKFHDWGRCDIAGHTVGVSHYIYKHKKKPRPSIKPSVLEMLRHQLSSTHRPETYIFSMYLSNWYNKKV